MLQRIFTYQIFGDLHGIQGCAFFYLIAYRPESQPFGFEISLRIRPTYTGSFPAISRGMG